MPMENEIEHAGVQKARVLMRRRLPLAAALAGVSALALVTVAPPPGEVLAQLSPNAQSQMGRAPLSFADVIDRVKPAVVSISVTGGTFSAPLKSVDAAKNTLTVTVDSRQGKVDKVYQVAKDAKVTVDGKEAKLADLKAGATLIFTQSVEDANTVIQIQTPRARRNQADE